MTVTRRAGYLLVGLVAFAAASWTPGAASGTQDDPAARARDLFVTNCASCHGAEGAGTRNGPSLVGVGAASADFQLRTGRMPLGNPDAPTLRSRPAFDDEEIALLVTYVASLGVGPDIPRVDPGSGDLSEGSLLFSENCAPCHGATANGGAVGGSAFAPSLEPSEPLDVAEAMITGPGEMPRFAFSESERNSILRYVEYLRTTDPPGGVDIGGIGPVPEGFVAWALVMVILVVVVVIIGTTRRQDERPEEGAPAERAP